MVSGVRIAETPVTVPAVAVGRIVSPSEVPPVLRDLARESLGAYAGSSWWEIGEFRREGDPYPVSVVGRRRGVDVQYAFTADWDC